MNRVFSYLVIATMFFVACNKNEQTSDNSFVLVMEDANLNISGEVHTTVNVATVKAKMNAIKPGGILVDNEIASANFENGGFKLSIPETFPDEYLGSMYEIFNIFSQAGITVSDRQVKTGDIWLYAYDDAGNYVGNFELVADECDTQLMFSDRKFTVKGIFNNGSTMDCSYHKGLNIEYIPWTEIHHLTTDKPLNKEFRWIFKLPPTTGF